MGKPSRDGPAAFFLPDGDGGFVGTDWTSGPWDPRLMHFGPPAALLGTRLVAAFPQDTPRRVVRLTFEILGPVPVGRVSLATSLVRPGRRISLAEGRMTAGDDERPVALARAWAIRETSVELPTDTPETPPPDGGPHGVPEVAFFSGMSGSAGYGAVNYGAAFELRSTTGGLDTLGDMAVWFRARVPLVADEALDPLARTLLVADSGNGVSARMDPREWLFVNPDLSVHLHRLPDGEWIGLDAATVLHPDGIGQATATLSDLSGAFGRSCQSLLVEPQATA